MNIKIDNHFPGWRNSGFTLLLTTLITISACNSNITPLISGSPTVETTVQAQVNATVTPVVNKGDDLTKVPPTTDLKLPTVTPLPTTESEIPTTVPVETPTVTDTVVPPTQPTQIVAPTDTTIPVTPTQAISPTDTPPVPTTTLTPVLAPATTATTSPSATQASTVAATNVPQPTLTATAVLTNSNPATRPLLYVAHNDPARPGAGNIHLVYPDGRDIAVSDGGNDYHPAWAPDNKHFLFVRSVPHTNAQIFLANADGQNLHMVADDYAADVSATPIGWSSEGKIVYMQTLPKEEHNPFQGPSQPFRVITLDLTNGKKDVQGYVNYMSGCGGYSPPEVDEALGTYDGRYTTLFRLNGLATFTTLSCTFSAGIITPDQKLVDGTKQPDPLHLYTYAIPSAQYSSALAFGRDSIAIFNGSGQQTRSLDLKNFKVGVTAMAWSPDGQWIYFSTITLKKGGKEPTLEKGAAIWRVHPDGTGVSKIYVSTAYQLLHLSVAADLTVAYVEINDLQSPETPLSDKHAVIGRLNPKGEATIIIKGGGEPTYPSN